MQCSEYCKCLYNNLFRTLAPLSGKTELLVCILSKLLIRISLIKPHFVYKAKAIITYYIKWDISVISSERRKLFKWCRKKRSFILINIRRTLSYRRVRCSSLPKSLITHSLMTITFTLNYITCST